MGLRCRIAALLVAACLSGCSPAAADAPWLTLNGAGGLPWGTSEQPLDLVPRSRAYTLPDSGYFGSHPADRPQDYELKGAHPSGERRFVRYVQGVLVDAWLVRDGPINTMRLELQGTEEWSGPSLGPGEGRLRAIGDAVSWQVGSRTALHWKDRMTEVEVLALRARPNAQYGVVRATALEPGMTGRGKARMRGSLKEVARPAEDLLSGCLNTVPKPVTAKITAVYDTQGRLGRVAVEVDQPAVDVDLCIAAALSTTATAPRVSGDLELFRMR